MPTYAADVSIRPGTFNAPLGYIRRSGKGPVSEADDYVEYDLEADDVAWLRASTRIGEAAEASMRLAPATFERMLDALEKSNGLLPSGETMPASEGAMVMAAAVSREPARFPLPVGLTLGTAVWTRTAQDIFSYWTAKRRRLGKPLLRRFWPQTQGADVNPHHTFRPLDRGGYKIRRTRRNDVEVFRKLQALKLDLERNAHMLRLVIDRETIKTDMLALRSDIFEQYIYELTDTTGVKRKPPTLETHRWARDAGSGNKLILGKLRNAGEASRQRREATEEERGGGGEGGGGDDEYEEAQAVRRPMKRTVSGGPRPMGAHPKKQKTDQITMAPRPQTTKEKRKEPTPGARPAGGSGGGTGSAPLPQHAGWSGFRLGPWTPPTTLSLTQGIQPHVEEAAFEPDDALGLSFALGGIMGVHCMTSALPSPPDSLNLGISAADPSVRSLLPSRGPTFPMDEGYVHPPDRDLYYADASLQRRMLNLRHTQGRSSGALGWEEALGTGLAAGIGSGVNIDGSGWEWLGFRLGSSILPYEETRELPLVFVFRLEELIRMREKAAEEAAAKATSLVNAAAAAALLEKTGSSAAPKPDDVSPPKDDDMGNPPALSTELETNPALSAAASAVLAAKYAVPVADVLDVLRHVGSDMLSAARRALAQTPPLGLSGTFAAYASRHAASDSESEGDVYDVDEDGARMCKGAAVKTSVVLRPRVGRGGRLMLDRVSLGFRAELAGTVEDSLRVLSRRNAAVRAARRAALQSAQLPCDDAAIAALSAAAPAALSASAAYRTLLARYSRSGAVRSRAADGPFAAEASVTGMATSYIFVTPPTAPGAASGGNSVPAVPVGGHARNLAFSSLYSDSISEVLRGSGDGGSAAAAALPIITSTLRTAGLRYTAALDATPALPRTLPSTVSRRSQASAPILPSEAAMADILHERCSDDERVADELAGAGPAALDSRYPERIFTGATLETLIQAMPLAQVGGP